MRVANYKAARDLLIELLTEHDPDGTFERALHLNRRKRGRGLCRYPKNGAPGRIEISKYLLENDLDDILNTVRHEVAHVIAGHAAGHGPVWKAAAVKVGAKPERCGKAMVHAETVAPWSIDCPNCGSIGTRHKITRALQAKLGRCHCSKCKSKGLTLRRQ